MKQILIIEDDLAILKGIQATLKAEAYDVSTASDGFKGFKMAMDANIDLIILDVMLPNKNGMDICRDLRKQGVNTLILMLTSKNDEIDKVLGLEAGADDYMTKPFSIQELKARIRALIRRVELSSKEHQLEYSLNKPNEEVRIFMFLDLKGSTSIAEKLGPIKYYNFLNDFFYDISFPIIQYKGEVYQYVGDEITISWSLPNGLDQANCIHCYFRIEDVIKELTAKYKKSYSLIPEFKASLHYGNVSSGIVGVKKRELVYSGDVLNTTARIQELCNKYMERILISKELLDIISLGEKFEKKEIGELILRGKHQKQAIYSLRRIHK